MSKAINKAKFQQFLRQARSNGVTEVQVKRLDRRNKLVVAYHGTAPKSKQRFNGEWLISKGQASEAQGEEVKGVLDQLREHFFVRRGPGLEEAAFADPDMEKEVKPIRKDEAEASSS